MQEFINHLGTYEQIINYPKLKMIRDEINKMQIYDQEELKTMDKKKRMKLLNMQREKAVQFVKDFRVMYWAEFVKKHSLTSVFAHEINKLVNDIIEKHNLTAEELAK